MCVCVCIISARRMCAIEHVVSYVVDLIRNCEICMIVVIYRRNFRVFFILKEKNLCYFCQVNSYVIFSFQVVFVATIYKNYSIKE